MIDYTLAKESVGHGFKGDDAGYHSKHQYLVRNFGNPTHCKFCDTEGHKESDGRWSIHWAKKLEAKYTHENQDYIGLCRKCHGKYDFTEEKRQNLIKAAESQKGNTSEAKSLIAKNRPRDEHGHFTKATA